MSAGVFAAVPGTSPAHLAVSRRVHPWKVVHAADGIERVLRIAELQADSGMLPSLLTTSGWLRPGAAAEHSSSPSSLLQQWRQVCRWRGALASNGAQHVGDLVHAHCFAASMAALRSHMVLVYDLAAPLGTESDLRRSPWLLRSFRVAESFVLSRASAVVVHTRALWQWALRQGVGAEDLFLVPEPVAMPTVDSATGQRPVPHNIIFFAAGVNDVASAEMLLRCFAIVAGEIESVQLLVDAAAELHPKLTQGAAALDISQRIHVVLPGDREQVWTSADVVIVAADPDAATAAMAHGRALLAADVPGNRDLTPGGRGCLWYRPGADRELAFRAAFLARNPDLRTALGRAGRAHLETTRSPRAIAEAYDAVYRHAVRRHGGQQAGLLPEMPLLQVV